MELISCKTTDLTKAATTLMRFGIEARTGIEDLTKIVLRRKILGD